MIYEYELTNFKAFPSSGAIPFRPITLVYGPNSSGKSSLLQSLLLMKQTLDESETPETLLLPKGNLVDLGGYREFVYRHDLEQPFAIRLAQDYDPKRDAGLMREFTSILKIEQIGLKITFGYDEKAASAVVKEFAFYVDDLRTPYCTFERRPFSAAERDLLGPRMASSGRGVFYRVASVNEKHPFFRRLAEIERDEFNSPVIPKVREYIDAMKHQLGELERLEAAAKEGTLPKRKRKSSRLADKQTIRDQISKMEKQLVKLERSPEDLVDQIVKRYERLYFGARNFLPGEVEVLPDPEEREGILGPSLHGRYFFTNGGAVAFAARVHTQAGHQFRQFLEGLVYLGPLRESPERHYVYSGNVTGQVGKTGKLVPDVLFKNPSLLRKVNEQLESFGIGYDLTISGALGGELSDVFSLRFVDRVTGVNASILDVGFGIGQVLPVIVQSMLASGKTLCIEQPEIHLHPRLQAELGSLLVACSKEPYGNRFIVETHSQHLMLRVQKLISTGELDRNNVSVLYVDKNSDGSRCLELRLDESGEFIDEWPHGFFEEGYEEVFSR